MVRYFLSYARSDGSMVVKELANRLRSIGHEAFLDTQGIEGGTEWEKELIRRTKWCDVALIIVTPGSNASKYVYNEFREAEKNHKLIIPVIVDNTPLPPYLTQYHALSIENESFDTLLLRLETSTRGVGDRHISGSRLLIPIAVIILIAVAVILVWNNSRVSQNAGGDQTKIVVVVTEVTPTIPLTITAASTFTPSFTNTIKPATTSTRALTLTPSVVPTTAIPTITPTLTPIPANKLLFHDDFEGSKVTTWSVTEGGVGVIKEADSNHVAVLSASSRIYLANSNNWTDYVVTLRYFVNDFGPEGGWNIDFRANSSLCNYYSLWLGQSWMSLDTRNAPGFSCSDNYTRQLFGDFTSNSAKQWHNLYISVKDYSIEWKLDNGSIHQIKDSSHTTGGLQIRDGVGSEIWLDDISVVSLK